MLISIFRVENSKFVQVSTEPMQKPFVTRPRCHWTSPYIPVFITRIKFHLSTYCYIRTCIRKAFYYPSVFFDYVARWDSFPFNELVYLRS